MLSNYPSTLARSVRFFFIVAFLANFSLGVFAQDAAKREQSATSNFSNPISFIKDAVNDYTPTYTGPRNGDLDVVNAEAGYTGCDFLFYSNSAADIGATSGGFFVWGINRGAGTARFGEQAPGVLFDAVVVVNLNPGRTSTVVDLTTGPPTVSVLPTSNIAVNGRNLLVRVPASLLPSKGFAPSRYTVNLWPRFQVAATSNALTDVADFAPDNSNALVVRDLPGKSRNRFFNFFNFGLFSAELEGFEGGDVDGSGEAILSVLNNASSRSTQICFDLSVGGIDAATSAQLRRGVDGPVVATFLAPALGSSIGCVDINDRNLLRELRTNPENFYLTVSNAEFPNGAVRGQLSSGNSGFSK